MEKNNTQKIRNLFFCLLQDGNNHTTKEIYDLIMKSPDIHILNSNTVYSTLHKIRKSPDSNYFIRNSDGSYRLKPHLLYPECRRFLFQLTNADIPHITNVMTADEAIQCWLSLYSEIESELSNAEASTERQKIRQLNDSIYKMIKTRLHSPC